MVRSGPTVVRAAFVPDIAFLVPDMAWEAVRDLSLGHLTGPDGGAHGVESLLLGPVPRTRHGRLRPRLRRLPVWAVAVVVAGLVFGLDCPLREEGRGYVTIEGLRLVRVPALLPRPLHVQTPQ